MLRQVFENNGTFAVAWEIAYQILRPLLGLYRHALWQWYLRRGKTRFRIQGRWLTVLPSDKGVSIELAVDRFHEPRASRLLAETLGRGMMVVDVGSNLGYYALLEASLVGPSGKVIAIEPVPQNAEQCKLNISMNGFSNVLFRQGAIGDHNGILPLHLSDKSNWHTMNSIPGPAKEILVPVCTLDSLVSELALDRVDLVRMDLEGYETVVLNGMRETIAQHSPRLLIEIHPHIVGPESMRKYFSTLQELGYAPEWVLDQERDVMWRWRFLSPEKLSMDQLIEDWRVNIHPRSLTVLFVWQHEFASGVQSESSSHLHTAPADVCA